MTFQENEWKSYDIIHLCCLLCFRGEVGGDVAFRGVLHFKQRYDVPVFKYLHSKQTQSIKIPWDRPGDKGAGSAIHGWVSGYRWLKQTRFLQLGQTIEPVSVSFLPHPATGHIGIALVSLQEVRRWDESIACVSEPLFTFIAWLHLGHMIAFPSYVEKEQLCDSGVLWCKQNAFEHLSQTNGRKSCCLQSSRAHRAPKSENSVI